MLEDYVSDLKSRLKQRRDASASAVIASGDSVERGKVQAFDLASDDVDEILAEYLVPEDGPPAARSAPVIREPRRFGARRAS